MNALRRLLLTLAFLLGAASLFDRAVFVDAIDRNWSVKEHVIGVDCHGDASDGRQLSRALEAWRNTNKTIVLSGECWLSEVKVKR